MHLFYEVRKKDFSIKNNLNEVSFSSHIHSDIEILYIRKGSQHITVNNVSYELKEGEAVIIFPNIVHSYYIEKKPARKIDAVLIICSRRFYGNFFPDMTNYIPLNPIIKREAVHKDVKYALENITKSNILTLQSSWTVIILTHLLQYIKVTQTNKSPVKDISYKVINYIEDHFTEPLTLESIANELFVSKNYISKVFSDKIKISFKRYINTLRTEYAAKLIRTTDDKLVLISEMAGFQSLATFNRAFKDIYGISPSDFRKNLQ